MAHRPSNAPTICFTTWEGGGEQSWGDTSESSRYSDRYTYLNFDTNHSHRRTSLKKTSASWEYSTELNAKSTSKVSQQVEGEGPGAKLQVLREGGGE